MAAMFAGRIAILYSPCKGMKNPQPLLRARISNNGRVSCLSSASSSNSSPQKLISVLNHLKNPIIRVFS
ncbi:hypothetical protein QJS04_geneDACA023556 [Acorus gramineus]|uniref:Uncharacterized protein n=1 Tax=Acorus gramineus TaxID=55184 RepID=A0AAV9BPW1_ACOGR|nr:hypothetical protein QJS04_geneDACA023556 [Acorus gramineus]